MQIPGIPILDAPLSPTVSLLIALTRETLEIASILFRECMHVVFRCQSDVRLGNENPASSGAGWIG